MSALQKVAKVKSYDQAKRDAFDGMGPSPASADASLGNRPRHPPAPTKSVPPKPPKRKETGSRALSYF